MPTNKIQQLYACEIHRSNVHMGILLLSSVSLFLCFCWSPQKNQPVLLRSSFHSYQHEREYESYVTHMHRARHSPTEIINPFMILCIHECFVHLSLRLVEHNLSFVISTPPCMRSPSPRFCVDAFPFSGLTEVQTSQFVGVTSMSFRAYKVF